ncbi:class II aldolase/adducin family protein [Pseudomonas typographi]|uniref:Class II aldolase n=1 Tax=Pseudomonas typographi TaxID=2715964 RepID=A0ABR7Z9A6_9PSED|nr:class II aldolase/adducin family protein [Pseudomonas typographi]MBD1602012.1 class II aldolase [Pseudomonas typographi]
MKRYGNSQLGLDIARFSAKIGADSLIVQGAGGNISWKDSGSLWVKASGTWLAEALINDIFVEVNLVHILENVEGGNYVVEPRAVGVSPLKPSIETLLHALMPHSIVVHLHQVDLLACLVRRDAEQFIGSKLGETVRWTLVNYYKPGAMLAKAVNEALSARPDADIIFLKNHGVVIGGDSVSDVMQKLLCIVDLLKVPFYTHDGINPGSGKLGYMPVSEPSLHALAVESYYLDRLVLSWALYPDHIVFLGPQAHVCDGWDAVSESRNKAVTPNLLFVKGHGVYSKNPLTRAESAQLRCYYDVLSRLPLGTELQVLSKADVQGLVNWEAEQYRVNLSK